MQVVQIIPFAHYIEKRWLMKKYKKYRNLRVEAFLNYIVIEKLS